MSDRLSDLPDELSYHILSFLDISDLTRFGCVSKRCSELHFSAPSLNFDLMSGSIVFASSCEKRTRVLNSLDRYLSRRGNKRIKSFCVRFVNHSAREWDDESCSFLRVHKRPCFCMDECFRVFTWADNAMRCKAEVLDLNLNEYECDNALVAPSSILHSGSLKTLDLQSGFNFPIIFQTPPSTFSSNLQWLDMGEVDLDEGFFKWISSSCKCIKHLTLQTAHSIENITIQSSSLESFYYECLQFERGRGIRLNIFAPNLKCMTWKGNTLFDQNMQSLTSLEKLHYIVDMKEEYKIVSGVLRSTDRVKHLTLNKCVVMVLYKDSRPDLKPKLRNVRHFCLESQDFDDTLVPALVSLFRGMQNLRTLKIFCGPSNNVRTKFGTGFWREQNLAFVHELEEVDINVGWGRTGIMFARYILENAYQLKRMRICHWPGHEKVVVSELNKGRKASNATVVFQQHQEYHPE